MSRTLALYTTRQFLFHVAIAFFAFFILVSVADLVDMSRRLSGKDIGTFGFTITMSVLRIPQYVEKLLPFAFLFGAMSCFLSLSRHQEIVVARAAGISVWKFLLPLIGVTFIWGIFIVTLWNPVSAVMLSRHDMLDAKYLEGKPGLMAVSDEGLWLRQADGQTQTVIRAAQSDETGTYLTGVMVLRFGADGRFLSRLDAAGAELIESQWQLRDARLIESDAVPRDVGEIQLPTNLTPTAIRDSFARPETLSVWSLPGFIEDMRKAGLSALGHRLHWHSAMSLPILLAVMVLIAAAFTLRYSSRGKLGQLLLAGVLTGFGFYLLNDMTLAFGLSGTIPPELAAWGPVGAMLLVGCTLLLHLEDG